ncbi:MAG: hypothetical protein MR782_05415 [Campylobacter sp.]|uniref:hypothetical protein n=1 Tax=Campylobacter sp. TaxID=205 RepID=UPI002A80BFCE|nr:hypothetical protein [Campylobacter sp.]MCI6340284.1 hypothetical protein [Campylobacter sp.]MDY4445583.1 hypothetical protein [Campylobacter sp.]
MILGVDLEEKTWSSYWNYCIKVHATQIKNGKNIYLWQPFNKYYNYNSRGPGKIAEEILDMFPYAKEVAPYEKIVFSLKDVKIKEAKHCILIDHHEGVSEDDIECLMKEMLELNKNEVYEHEIIQILPFAFGLGDGNEIKNPLGVVVPRLEVSANIIYARKEKLDFMRKIIKKLGTRVKSYNFVYSEYAKMIAKLEADKIETYDEYYERTYSSDLWVKELLFGLCLYGRGYNALYEVDSNGDVLLKGF